MAAQLFSFSFFPPILILDLTFIFVFPELFLSGLFFFSLCFCVYRSWLASTQCLSSRSPTAQLDTCVSEPPSSLCWSSNIPVCWRMNPITETRALKSLVGLHGMCVRVRQFTVTPGVLMLFEFEYEYEYVHSRLALMFWLIINSKYSSAVTWLLFFMKVKCVKLLYSPGTMRALYASAYTSYPMTLTF